MITKGDIEFINTNDDSFNHDMFEILINSINERELRHIVLALVDEIQERSKHFMPETSATYKYFDRVLADIPLPKYVTSKFGPGVGDRYILALEELEATNNDIWSNLNKDSQIKPTRVSQIEKYINFLTLSLNPDAWARYFENHGPPKIQTTGKKYPRRPKGYVVNKRNIKVLCKKKKSVLVEVATSKNGTKRYYALSKDNKRKFINDAIIQPAIAKCIGKIKKNSATVFLRVPLKFINKQYWHICFLKVLNQVMPKYEKILNDNYFSHKLSKSQVIDKLTRLLENTYTKCIRTEYCVEHKCSDKDSMIHLKMAVYRAIKRDIQFVFSKYLPARNITKQSMIDIILKQKKNINISHTVNKLDNIRMTRKRQKKLQIKLV
jgi:hypothetical protein